MWMLLSKMAKVALPLACQGIQPVLLKMKEEEHKEEQSYVKLIWETCHTMPQICYITLQSKGSEKACNIKTQLV